jgi:hypothetical protein
MHRALSITPIWFQRLANLARANSGQGYFFSRFPLLLLPPNPLQTTADCRVIVYAGIDASVAQLCTVLLAFYDEHEDILKTSFNHEA